MKDVVFDKDITSRTAALIQSILLLSQKYSHILLEDTNPELIDNLIASEDLDRSEVHDSDEMFTEILQEYITHEIFHVPRRRFYISNHGRVISVLILADGRICVRLLSIFLDNDGYERCGCSNEGRSATFLVHRVVLIAVGPAPDGEFGSDVSKYHCDHKDWNRSHNHISNLQWLTPLENTLARQKHIIHNALPRKTFVVPADWKDHEYKSHPKYPYLLASHKGVLVVNETPLKYNDSKGYWRFSKGGDFVLKKVHRVVWECCHDKILEKGVFIDHVDGDTFNNSFENLRLVTASENARNRLLQKNNSSGITGVSFAKEEISRNHMLLVSITML